MDQRLKDRVPGLVCVFCFAGGAGETIFCGRSTARILFCRATPEIGCCGKGFGSKGKLADLPAIAGICLGSRSQSVFVCLDLL